MQQRSIIKFVAACFIVSLTISGNVYAELYARYNAAGNCDARSGGNLSSAGGYLLNVGPKKKVVLHVQCALNIPAKILNTRKISKVRVSVKDGTKKYKVKVKLCAKNWTNEKIKCGKTKSTKKSGKGAMFLDLKMPNGKYNSSWIIFVKAVLPKAKSGNNGIGHMSVYLK